MVLNEFFAAPQFANQVPAKIHGIMCGNCRAKVNFLPAELATAAQ
jgi:hypothetical protein